MQSFYTCYRLHDIDFDDETGKYIYALAGWIYEVDTIEEAKADIDENYSASVYFYRHCL